MYELHETVHWRSIRRIVKLFCSAENISLCKYNLKNIRCYRTYGKYLNGKNVLFTSKASPFLNLSEFDVFEIPKKENKYLPLLGNFLVLAHNIKYDYWIFTKLKYSIDFRSQPSKQLFI